MKCASENTIKYQIKSSAGVDFIETILALVKMYIENFLEIEFE